jgi:hypothetical protein
MPIEEKKPFGIENSVNADTYIVTGRLHHQCYIDMKEADG